MRLLVEISEYFRELREKYYDPLGLIDPISERVDPSILVHQIPGGMFSNLISQLKEQNALERLKEVLEEVPKVRKELGFPPLVTPTSQLVGTQAVFNVISGERYSIVPKEVKDYARGLYGKPPAPIDKKVKRKIIGEEKPIACRPADLLKPELETLPKEAKRLARSEEDALTYVLFPKAALEFFQKRKFKRVEKKSRMLSGLERQELAEVAAVSAAVASYLASKREVLAVIPTRRAITLSAWSLAGRRELTEPLWGSYFEGA
jgi:pyruvate/oxaloacetate carboxyltransferase